MIALLLLPLMTFHGVTEAATVTLTEIGKWTEKYPWPALGRIRLSIACSASLPTVNMNLYAKGRGGINWHPDNFNIFCKFAPEQSSNYSFSPDCRGGGNVTYTVQFETESIRIVGQGAVEEVRKREGNCASVPDWWRLKLSTAGRATATDQG